MTSANVRRPRVKTVSARSYDAAAAGEVTKLDRAGRAAAPEARSDQDGDGMFESAGDGPKREHRPLGGHTAAAAHHKEREIIDNGYVRLENVDGTAELAAEIAAGIPLLARLFLSRIMLFS